MPRFAAGNAMMYAAGRAEIEEFVRYGAPRAWLDDARANERLGRQHLRMPAYGERLGDGEIADLVDFACAVEGVGLSLEGEAAAGRELAREQGCDACHGVGGSGGVPNPGSLGGFIPGFLGGNFADLVRDEAEFREWVEEGTSSRLAANPFIRYFWRRQAIQMPAYREELTDDEIGRLWSWVEEMRRSG